MRYATCDSRPSIWTLQPQKVLFVGQASLRRAIGEYMAHYHEERNHQGLGNRLIRPERKRATNTALIQRHARLGGMLNYYYRAEA